jgi:hypothetical protein
MLRVSCYIFTFLLALQACKTNKLSNGDDSFYGTISYNINLKMNVDTIYQKDRFKFYGNRVDWTYFKNGDVQQKFFGSSLSGLDIIFWDLSENQVVTKYNSSDTLFIKHSNLKFADFIKNMNVTTNSLYPFNFLMKVPATSSRESYYYTYSCDFSDALCVNPTIYENVNYDNFYDIISKTEGCLPLNYQIDYFTYQINYRSKNVSSLIVKYNDKLHKRNPRVFFSDLTH